METMFIFVLHNMSACISAQPHMQFLCSVKQPWPHNNVYVYISAFLTSFIQLQEIKHHVVQLVTNT